MTAAIMTTDTWTVGSPQADFPWSLIPADILLNVADYLRGVNICASTEEDPTFDPMHIVPASALRAAQNVLHAMELVNRHWSSAVTGELYRQPILTRTSCVHSLTRTLGLRPYLSRQITEIMLLEVAVGDGSFHELEHKARCRADRRAGHARDHGPPAAGRVPANGTFASALVVRVADNSPGAL
jgi:hypothetical protein